MEAGGNSEITPEVNAFDMTEAPDFEALTGAAEQPRSAEQEVLDFAEMAAMPAEMKPLAADGSTEKKMGHIAVDLMGDVMDKVSEKQVREKLSEFKQKPYELNNYRDEEMVQSLRSNFGRIFGNNAGADEGEQAA